MSRLRKLGNAIEGVLLNPVFVREFRVRLRGARGFWLMLAYTGIVATVGLLVAAVLMRNHGWSAPSPEALGTASRASLLGMVLAQVILVSAALPGMLGTAISFERQGNTLEQVAITPLSATHVVLGKFAAAMVQAGYLMLAAGPVMAICLLMGGVSWGMLLPGLVLCIASAAAAGSVSVCCSSLFRSPMTGVVVAYIILLSINIGAPFAEVLLDEVARSSLGAGYVYRDPISPSFLPWWAAMSLIDGLGPTMSGYWIDGSLMWIPATGACLVQVVILLLISVLRTRTVLRMTGP